MASQLYFRLALSCNRLEWSVCSACHLPTFVSSDLIKQMLFRRRPSAISPGQSVRTHSHPTKHLDARRFARLCKRSARILLYCMSSVRVVAVSFLSRNALYTSAIPFVRRTRELWNRLNGWVGIWNGFYSRSVPYFIIRVYQYRYYTSSFRRQDSRQPCTTKTNIKTRVLCR